MRTVSFSTAVLAIPLAFFVPTVAAELKGDEQAIALAELMIDRLGGTEIWSGAQSLYLEYEGWRTAPAQPVVERTWRGLSAPIQKAVFQGHHSDTTFFMNREASWLQFSEGDPRIFNAAEHANNLEFWNYDFYTSIHNLARGDERIALEYKEPRTVVIKGPRGADWGWFEIDSTGQPVRWGAPDGEDTLEYIYGPVRSFGNIDFPAWGTARDGSWRFAYRVVDVSRAPLDIVLTPPTVQ